MPLNNLTLKKKSNSTENIFNTNDNKKNIYGILSMNNLNINLHSRNEKNSDLIDVPYFNKKLDELGVTKNNYKIKEKNIINTNTNSSNILSQKFNKTIFNYAPSLFKSFSNINNLMNLKTAQEISDELKNNIKDDK